MKWKIELYLPSLVLYAQPNAVAEITVDSEYVEPLIEAACKMFSNTVVVVTPTNMPSDDDFPTGD
jgi:hypothetical protein